jgi:hypothetical protein
MNTWRGFAGCAGLALFAFVPAVVLASSFEDGLQVSDRSELFSPVAESVLVDTGSDSVSLDGTVGLPLQREYVEPDEQAVPCASCPGCESDDCPRCIGCIDDGSLSVASCTDSDSAPRRSRAGWINRILGPADPRWVVQVDALMLWQGNIASRPILLNGAGLTALDVNQAQTPVSVGTRYGVLFNLDECFAVEGNYFQAGLFDGRAAPVGAGPFTPAGLYGVGPLLGQIDTAQLTSSGFIKSAELNWRRRNPGPLTWLAGFRWVEWNQGLGMNGTYSTGQLGAGNVASSTVTGNDLYGGQVGADLSLWNNKNGPITVNGIGKAGIFYNNAFQHSAVTTTARGTNEVGSVADQTAFFGEVGANANIRLTNWLFWRAGYSVFWLSGVAIPADQLSQANLAVSPPTALINTNGSVLLHGVTTGLEARW